MKRIALVTPLKSEIENISKLIKSIDSQCIKIYYWIIVENDSDDGSAEKLLEIDRLENIVNFKVLNVKMQDKSYQLGTKYASVVNIGFEYIKKQDDYSTLDYIGINDSDCFPTPNYFGDLVNFMEKDSELGISSGMAYISDSKKDLTHDDWVKGNCRLWKKECFDEAGYLVGPAADTLSLIKAISKGWKAYPYKSIYFYTREQGERTNFKYYGYAAYYRGHTPFYILLKSFYLCFKKEIKYGWQFSNGYFRSFFKREKKTQDVEIIKYCKNYLFNKLHK